MVLLYEEFVAKVNQNFLSKCLNFIENYGKLTQKSVVITKNGVLS